MAQENAERFRVRVRLFGIDEAGEARKGVEAQETYGEQNNFLLDSCMRQKDYDWLPVGREEKKPDQSRTSLSSILSSISWSSRRHLGFSATLSPSPVLPPRL